MNLKGLKKLFANNGCNKLFVKRLSPNDNSKNQVYLGGDFEVLNILPFSDIKAESAGAWKRNRFKATVNFLWISDDSTTHHAPQAQLILYPNYPEVRFSGFLKGCDNAPSELMTQRIEDRVLFLGVNNRGQILGYVSAQGSSTSNEFIESLPTEKHGVFHVIEINGQTDSKTNLILELFRIHRKGWISSYRLDAFGKIIDCHAPNCGGYTLEAELGITPNGYSEPDFHGWELKQFGVSSFSKLNSAVITLMTPEPTSGFYSTNGAEEFIIKYGYLDKRGRVDRMNFGGIHKVGKIQALTGLEMIVEGFDPFKNEFTNVDGKIALVERNGNIAASWSLASLLKHWNRKHNQACYIPSLSKIEPQRMYFFGDTVYLGTGTDFRFFLAQLAAGNIYYDPGLKIESLSTKRKIKKRSQFRIKFKNIADLYKKTEVIKLNSGTIVDESAP